MYTDKRLDYPKLNLMYDNSIKKIDFMKIFSLVIFTRWIRLPPFQLGTLCFASVSLGLTKWNGFDVEMLRLLTGYVYTFTCKQMLCLYFLCAVHMKNEMTCSQHTLQPWQSTNWCSSGSSSSYVKNIFVCVWRMVCEIYICLCVGKVAQRVYLLLLFSVLCALCVGLPCVGQ